MKSYVIRTNPDELSRCKLISSMGGLIYSTSVQWFWYFLPLSSPQDYKLSNPPYFFALSVVSFPLCGAGTR